MRVGRSPSTRQASSTDHGGHQIKQQHHRTTSPTVTAQLKATLVRPDDRASSHRAGWLQRCVSKPGAPAAADHGQREHQRRGPQRVQRLRRAVAETATRKHPDEGVEHQRQDGQKVMHQIGRQRLWGKRQQLSKLK